MANYSEKMRPYKIGDVFQSFSSKDRIARLQVLCERSADAKQMLTRLRDIQLRMGTSVEGPGDQGEAASIAHKLNNMLMLYPDEAG